MRYLTTAVLATVCALGFGQGGFQGPYQGPVDRSVDAINRGIENYLNGDELRSILTPGEFVEWKIDLNASQVLVAEARSDVFDPALEITDEKGTILASNDDRYPGDQRPLLLWRCPSEGAYRLRVRCYHNRSGGECFVRFRKYESINLVSGDPVEKELAHPSPFMVRCPMKAGEILQLTYETGGPQHFLPCVGVLAISGSGLPVIEEPALRIRPAINAFEAPVTGDYYFFDSPSANGGAPGRVRVRRSDVAVTSLSQNAPVTATTGKQTLWEVAVKKGELLEASATGLEPGCILQLAEVPDVSKYDVEKFETNPFYPHPPQAEGPVVDFLPKRSRDHRMVEFRVRHDAKLWIASNGAGPAGKAYAISVRPGATAFAEDRENVGKLRIADTDYWAFDARAGDVISLDAKSPDFADLVMVRDPDLGELRHFEPALDQTSDSWRMVAQKPGRYLVSVSCVGNGGSGTYSLNRRTIHPQELTAANPVKTEIAPGQVQVWKFTIGAHEPALMHWTSSNWSYDVALYDDEGNQTDFQRDAVDDHTRFGLISKPQTYIIVLTGGREKAEYSIELGPVPGYRAR